MIVTDRVLLWAWLNTRLGTPWSSDFRAIGLVKDGVLCAVAGYNAFAGRLCNVHWAIDNPEAITRHFIKCLFQYPFIQCNLTHIIAPIEAANTHAMDVDLRLGFKELVRFPHSSLGGSDLVLLGMSADECKWIKGAQYGKQQQEISATAAGLFGGSENPGGCERSPGGRTDQGQPPRCIDPVGFTDMEPGSIGQVVH